MSITNKTFFVKSFIVLVIITVFSSLAFAYVWKNWRECVNEPDCTSQSLTPTLKIYIVESAGYFLASHSDYQALLNRVELSEANGVDYNDLREILYSTIENMEKARASYVNLKTTSEKIPYNQRIIELLMKFDYDGFRAKYGLVEPIFAKVKTFLGKGDIRGLDFAILAKLDAILSKLYIVKAAADKDKLPEISLLWRTNQAYAEAHLLGQYVSEVFRDILL